MIMKKFLVIYHATVDFGQMSAGMTPEEQAAGMKPWMDWKEKLGDKMIDMGTALFNGTELKPDGQSNASGKQVTGFSIIQAADIDEAKDLCKDHPHFAYGDGFTVEIHEYAQF